MRIPKFLEESGTIGFVAPAFGCNMNLTGVVLMLRRKRLRHWDIP